MASQNNELEVVKPKNQIVENLATAISTPENIQKYILGTKSNGQPRAVYDVIKDYTKPSKDKKKKKKGKGNDSQYSIYLSTKGKKKKKKKDKHWHI